MKFRDFEDSEISRILKFRDFDDFEIPRFLRYYIAVMNGEGAVREAHGRVFRTRFHTSNHAHDAPRSLRSKFGKIEIFRFRKFGSEIWAALGLSCVQSPPMGGTLRCLTNLSGIIGF